MKLQILSLQDESEAFVDCYVNETKIVGYYFTSDNDLDDSVNLLFDGTTITVKRDTDMIDYLIKKGWH